MHSRPVEQWWQVKHSGWNLAFCVRVAEPDAVTIRPEMGRVHAVHATEEFETELGVFPSQGTLEAISVCVRRGGSLEGDDCVWEGNGLVGAAIDGRGLEVPCSGWMLIVGMLALEAVLLSELICGSGREF